MSDEDTMSPLPCPFCDGVMQHKEQGWYCFDKGIFIQKRSIVEAILEIQEERRNAAAEPKR